MSDPTTIVDRSVLVDTDWLIAHLDDPRLRLVEVDVNPRAYQDWHLAGAALWNIYADLKTPEYQTIGPSEFAALLDRTGITPESTVVFYGYGPALGLWLMEYFGHSGARILDRSRDALRASALARTTGPAAQTAEPSAATARTGDAGMRASLEMVRAAIADRRMTVLDARSAAEYAGRRFWPSGTPEPGGRAGHVPNAVSVPLDAIEGGLYDELGRFRPAAELRRAFAAVDLDTDDPVIAYCTIGNRAAIAWFVLHHLLGRSGVRVYDGSWAEWGHLPDTPIESD